MFDAQHVKRPGNDWSSAEPTQKSGRTKRSTQHSGDLTCIPRYAQAWGNQPPPWLRPSIQQQAPPEEEALPRATKPTQHKENMTGLPDTLKASVEKLSGLSMDDVQVHYNSSQAAEVQALAYTQGTDIHVGPGQQQHLGHEAWHVVQQMQGRVQPTMQMKNMAINEEQGLEREADMMAAKISESVRNSEESTDTISSASKDNPIRSSRIYPLQMKLNKVLSDEVDSPAGAIKKQLGNIPVKDLSLPGTQPAGQEERARKVEAIVDKSTLRDTERKKSGNLSKVTTMARAEQFILQGADVKKFFDAGHLVGDQLVGGEEDTFQLWNLAPQASVFNSPVYLQIMEEEIRAATAGGKVKVVVTVDYPDGGMYKVSLASLIERRIVPSQPSLAPNSVVINKQTFSTATLVSIPRRIPNTWTIAATLTPSQTFRGTEKLAGSEGLIAHFDNLSKRPTIGMPFYFNVYDAKIANKALKLVVAPQRLLAATQWTPSAIVPLEDLISLVATTFPDLGSKDIILKKLAGDGNVLIPEKEIQLVFAASNVVGGRLTQVMQGMTRILDTSLIRGLIDDYRQKIMNQLQLADQAVKTSPPNLTEALNRILTAQSIIEDLLEEFESEREKQEEQYTFPLSTHIAIQQAFQKAFTEVPPEPSSNVTMATHKLESPPAYPYPETDKRFIGPHVEKGRRTEEGAEIIIMHFGPPTEPGRRILTDDGLVTVTKVFAEFELGATMPSGPWHIMYKYGLHQ